ncbi:hypothetical protein EWM64_g8562 [Hericium alpestre]|uniref:Ubiquitin-like protease family profile domain-containing protein n=1 Tax=Hericium alpestre TaxID=135208 RepID=A0A4Y9ZMH8_9AGAM|nr:hypothetical protein EWM64_g8562 [Hericium alpestre]
MLQLQGRPAHWVFSIFDLQMKTISIFNSIPKLMSSKWAVPMTKDIIGSIRQVVALRDADWDSKPWTENVFNPPPSEEQCDVWSCGLFIMMAMQAFAQERFNFSRCVNARIRDIHAQALRAMFDIPCIIFLITWRTKADFDLKRRRSDLTLSGGEDFDKDVFMQDTRTESSDAAPANYAQSASSEFPDVHMTDRELTSTKSHSPPSGAGSLQIAVPYVVIHVSLIDDGQDMDDEKATVSFIKEAGHLFEEFRVVNQNREPLTAAFNAQRFIRYVLAGRSLNDNGQTVNRLIVNPRMGHVVNPQFEIMRDYDSIIGVDKQIPYTIPLAIFPVPPFSETLKKKNHIEVAVTVRGTEMMVSLHNIPNLALGKVAQRHVVRCHFPASLNQGDGVALSQPMLRDFYNKVLRPSMVEAHPFHASHYPIDYTSAFMSSGDDQGRLHNGTIDIPHHCLNSPPKGTAGLG